MYLQRWTRMGQMRDESLEQLLLLGEPEAVVAVVCAPGLTDELARRAWWAMGNALANRVERLLQVHHAHVLAPRAVKAACACAMSSNGRRTPAVSW